MSGSMTAVAGSGSAAERRPAADKGRPARSVSARKSRRVGEGSGCMPILLRRIDGGVDFARLSEPSHVAPLGPVPDFAEELHRLGLVARLVRVVGRDDQLD